jgi:hypothetical protein
MSMGARAADRLLSEFGNRNARERIGWRRRALRGAEGLASLAERRSVLEVAKQAGHSPTMALTTYGHVIEDLEGTEKQIPEEVIRRARDELVRTTFAGDQGSRRALSRNPCKPSEAL